MPSKLTTFALTFGVAAMTVYVLVTSRDLLIPFAIAVMIWYLINALSKAIERFTHYPRWLTMSTAIVVLVVLVSMVVELISGNVEAVRAAAPSYQANIEKLIAQAMALGGFTEKPTFSQIVNQIDVRSFIGSVAGAVASIAGNAGLILVYVIFLLAEQTTFDRKLKALFPDADREAEVREVIIDIQTRTQTYISVKTLLSILAGVISYILLVAVGVDLAGFWAFMIFLLNYVPTVGSLLGVAFPAVLTIIQFGSIGPFLIVAAGLGTSQFLIGNVLEPRLMGSSLNISSLVVILSLVVWGSIWGVTGMFLCVPFTVILMIILAEFPQTRGIAILLSADGKV